MPRRGQQAAGTSQPRARPAVATRTAPPAPEPAPAPSRAVTSASGSVPPPSSSRSTPQPHEGPAEPVASRFHPNGSAGGTGRIAAGAAGLGARGAGGNAQPPTFEGQGGGSPARLLGGSPCGDLFPHSARRDDGTVEVALELAQSGEPLASRIVDEAPRGQGFGVAASHCVRRLRFAPALDRSGQPVASRSVVQLRFARRHESARAAL